MTHKQYLTAQEAAEALAITRSTLYSYVSRGLIRSEPVGEGRRTHRYAAADVLQLLRRKQQRQEPALVAEQALDWGAPVLESAITLIENGRFYYRGLDVLQLARQSSVEQVAALIWTGALDNPLFQQGEGGDVVAASLAPLLPALEGLAAVERFQVMLPLVGAGDFVAYDLQRAALLQTGVRLLRLLVALAVGRGVQPGHSLVHTLQAGWQLPAEASPLLEAALILCADHELNVSAFTARCVASAGGTLYGVVEAGLAALRGVHHGGYTERVEALLQEVGRPELAHAVLAARLKRGEPIPGFGHPLYPEGDPRARLLLQLVKQQYGQTEAALLVEAVVEAAAALINRPPTVDLGLVAVARALALPPGSALALFALGRTIGWVGHALEQVEQDTLIRPRARYVGHLPGA